ncbi:Tat pathway signal protein [Kribbella qitaiheensis]|uniref:Tat pathway signal protein n=1 Tax=Kribbella qitaiheensis TaxID=1544730 RepID=A0A7G6WW38_9ACTN|nr:Tat pathway signal protein [Kribbella qitaiheensis]QNE18203.1 Tat pathway signal protein [Kribbella qitaiheensis]
MSTTSSGRNTALADWMRLHGVTNAEMAERINAAILAATGTSGNVIERTVYRWRAGESRSPQARQRQALEAVTGLSAAQLGLVDRKRARQSAREEGLHRRAFLAAATTTTLATLANRGAGARPTVGTSDVNRLRVQLRELWLLDDQFGGGLELEQRAAALTERTLGLQQNGAATQRVRSKLYAMAAAFESAAMFAAMDSRRFPAAQLHLDKAIRLAGLSNDGQVQHQAWRQASMLSGQTGRYTDALAAAEVCGTTSSHRRDPLFASLTQSRIALAASNLGDRPRALRALERAAAAYDRVDPAIPQPASMSSYTFGELHGLAGIVHYRLGIPDESEFHTHRCLSQLRPDQHRNRAYYGAQTALAQLAQDDVEQAVATALAVPATAAGGPTGRTSHLLRSFSAALAQKAPNTTTLRDWNDFIRTL